MKRIFTLALAAIAALSASARQPEQGYRGFLDWSNSLHRPVLFGTEHLNLHN